MEDLRELSVETEGQSRSWLKLQEQLKLIAEYMDVKSLCRMDSVKTGGVETMCKLRNSNIATLFLKIWSIPGGVDAKDAFGPTPLIYASSYGSKEVVAALIEAGADLNQTNKYGAILCTLRARVVIWRWSDALPRSIRPSRMGLLLCI